MQTLAAKKSFPGIAQDDLISELDDIDWLVRTYRAPLLRLVVFCIADEHVAASIVQDTFLRAWSARHSFRGECTVRSWLTSIAFNLVRKHQRIRKFQFWRKPKAGPVDICAAAAVLPAIGSSPEDQLLAREQARHIAAALKDLSLYQRSAFLLRFQEEMELGEIAVAMRMPIHTVRKHLQRAVRAIRSQFGGRHE